MKPTKISRIRPIAALLFSVILPLILVVSGCWDERLKARSTAPSSANNQAVTAPTEVRPAAPHQQPLSSAAGGMERNEAGKAGDKAGMKDDAKTQDVKYRTGEDPEFAKEKGWPVKYPAPLPGSILPGKRIVAYYGNPLSKRMGVLGEYRKDEMLRKLRQEVSRWNAADPALPVQPALHLIAVVAQGEPGKAGKYRMIMPDEVVNQVYGWAREAGAVLFIDIQTGHDDIRTLLPRFEWLLKNPDVHLGIDPEFNLKQSGAKPGDRIGTYDAADINYVTGFLKDLVRKHNVPPKVLTVHRFTQNGVTNYRKIVLRSEVQVVMNMDGWGGPPLKRRSYKDYVVAEPVQFTGFKLFYHNDSKKGDPLLTPKEVLKLQPKPIYIQYQ